MGQDGVMIEPCASSVNVSWQQGVTLVLCVKSNILPEELSTYSTNGILLYMQLFAFFILSVH